MNYQSLTIYSLLKQMQNLSEVSDSRGSKQFGQSLKIFFQKTGRIGVVDDLCQMS
jgi:hypothetical protein